MRIEKPDWKNKCLSERVKGDSLLSCLAALDYWFEDNVAPVNKMLSAGVEVYHDRRLGDCLWETDEKENITNTHTALLINIQPIKKETAEDVLRYLIKDGAISDNQIEKAKTALENK